MNFGRKSTKLQKNFGGNEKPYYKQVKLEVPDNWWPDSSYYNIPLDIYASY